jgi:hypothetical protein
MTERDPSPTGEAAVSGLSRSCPSACITLPSRHLPPSGSAIAGNPRARWLLAGVVVAPDGPVYRDEPGDVAQARENGTNSNTVTASPVSAIAIMSTLAEVDKRGT